MANTTRIKYNPVTGEIEIEGSEAFVKKYIKKLQEFSAGKKKDTIRSTVKKEAAKTKKSSKVSQLDLIISALKKSKQGMSVKDIAKKTKLSGKQINPVLMRGLKEGTIKRVSRGVYSLLVKV
jgi:hypothetical protein